MTKCTLRSQTIWTIFSVSGLPFPFYKMCVPSDLYLCYLQPLLSSPGWTPAKSALVSVAFFPLHCICLIVIRVYFIYIEFFSLGQKKIVHSNQSFPPSNITWFLYSPVLAIISMCLMLLVSGIVTTATFTLMMQCSKRAPSHIQASHYTTLATLEVVGKLLFSVSLGSVTDAIGYENVFILFLVLTTLVISFLQSCPQELTHHQEEVSVKNKSEWVTILLSDLRFFNLTD